ncbi:MAG: hypothetical protein ACRDPW_03090 [Mycobacteriales bacterium]
MTLRRKVGADELIPSAEYSGLSVGLFPPPLAKQPRNLTPEELWISFVDTWTRIASGTGFRAARTPRSASTA